MLRFHANLKIHCDSQCACFSTISLHGGESLEFIILISRNVLHNKRSLGNISLSFPISSTWDDPPSSRSPLYASAVPVHSSSWIVDDSKMMKPVHFTEVLVLSAMKQRMHKMRFSNKAYFPCQLEVVRGNFISLITIITKVRFNRILLSTVDLEKSNCLYSIWNYVKLIDSSKKKEL